MWKQTLRDLAFPAFILVFWVIATGYTVSRLLEFPKSIAMVVSSSAQAGDQLSGFSMRVRPNT